MCNCHAYIHYYINIKLQYIQLSCVYILILNYKYTFNYLSTSAREPKEMVFRGVVREPLLKGRVSMIYIYTKRTINSSRMNLQ